MKNVSHSSLLNPVFHERTANGDVFYDIQSRLVKDRVIFLSEPVTQQAAGVMSSLLFMMNNEDPTKKISIWLNTPGGDAHAFFAIYDMMQMVKAPIETVCLGQSMSAGVLLLASGSKGMRYAMPSSGIMAHQIQIGGVGGTGTEVQIEVEEILKMKQRINEILARHTGKTVEQVTRDCEHNKYFTAQEALDYGIIDKIMPLGKELPPLLTESKKLAVSVASTKTTASKKSSKKAPKKTSKKASKK